MGKTVKYVPLEDGKYDYLISRKLRVENNGTRIGLDFGVYDCNTGEWEDMPHYTTIYDTTIRLCRAVEADGVAVPPPEGAALPAPFILEPGSNEHRAMAGVLADYMSDLSEEAYFAGWMNGCEYEIWQELQAGQLGWYIRDTQAMAALTMLANMIDGWIKWNDEAGGTCFVPIDEWQVAYEDWRTLKQPRPVTGSGEEGD